MASGLAGPTTSIVESSSNVVAVAMVKVATVADDAQLIDPTFVGVPATTFLIVNVVLAVAAVSASEPCRHRT